MKHVEIIQVVIGYSFAAVIVFTAFATAASLVGWIKFSDSQQQKKLFNVLIIELVIVGIGSFSAFLKFDVSDATETTIRKSLEINVNPPQDYAVYTNSSAGLGFAYPENNILNTSGEDIKHGDFELEGFQATRISIATTVLTDAEKLLRDEQGKSQSYYLERAVRAYENALPFTLPGIVYIRDEEYPSAVGEGRLVIFDYDIADVHYELHAILIYTSSHQVHRFILLARQDEIERAKVVLRNIVATIVVPKSL